MGGLAFSKPRPLKDDDPIDGFACGLDVVDTWLRTRARTAREAGSAVVYVSFCADRLPGSTP